MEIDARIRAFYARIGVVLKHVCNINEVCSPNLESNAGMIAKLEVCREYSAAHLSITDIVQTDADF